MNIHLTRLLEDFVRAQVETGDYNNASEVVRDALRLLKQQRKEDALKLERLRQVLTVGDNSGAAEPFDFDEFMAEVRAES